jgi:8-oxo-dGTP pyrophosphatase MutT (NUDIX family)
MQVKFAFSVIVNNMNEFLILRRSSTDEWMPLKWYLPGGTMKEGESSSEAAVRETFEETNLVLDPSKIDTVLVRERVEYFLCPPDSWSGEILLKLTDGIFEHDLFEWVSLKESSKFELVPGFFELLTISEKKILEEERKTKKVLRSLIRKQLKES